MSDFRLIKALLKEPVDCTPVWMMRQAGRYLPEYRELRATVDGFMGLCQNPELACEVTLQPLRRFDLDAAILFSDILTIPDAMGLGLYFENNEGPKFKNPVRTEADVKKLFVPDPSKELNYVIETVRKIKKELSHKTPLIGFAGSPWTIATYMIEGGSTKSFSIIKKMMYQSPELLHQVLSVLAKSVAVYLNAQIEAGVDTVMIFDTWGGVLTPETYELFSLNYMKQIVDELKKTHDGRRIPNILFTKQASQWLEVMASSGCDALGVDWTIDIGEARARVGNQVALQGNLDPAVLNASPEVIRESVKTILESFGDHPGHVFNLGHGITPDIPFENVKVMVDAVHEFSHGGK
jgi:uroporphyrinogen decarboxylase